VCKTREDWVLLLEREGTLSALDQQDSKLQKGETGDELRKKVARKRQVKKEKAMKSN